MIETFAGRALSRPRLAWALVYEPLDAPVDEERIRYRRAYAQRMAAFVRERVESGELPDQDSGHDRGGADRRRSSRRS